MSIETVIFLTITVICSCPIWGSFGWHIWELYIRPRLIPENEIIEIAENMLAKFGADAEERALIEEDHAWRRSESFEQGTWHRVRLCVIQLKRAERSHPIPGQTHSLSLGAISRRVATPHRESLDD